MSESIADYSGRKIYRLKKHRQGGSNTGRGGRGQGQG